VLRFMLRVRVRVKVIVRVKIKVRVSWSIYLLPVRRSGLQSIFHPWPQKCIEVTKLHFSF